MKRSLVICNIICAAASFFITASWRLADTLILDDAGGGIPFWAYGLGGAALSEVIFFTVIAVMKRGGNDKN